MINIQVIRRFLVLDNLSEQNMNMSLSLLAGRTVDLFIPMGYPIHIDIINVELSILYLKGLVVMNNVSLK